MFPVDPIDSRATLVLFLAIILYLYI
jgi:hypothetical protein